jgi:MFS family permease
MTVFCGLSMNVGQLVVARIGVGIGEAAASPGGFSLLSDWFSRAKRGTALGIYIAGLYLGSGLALAIGGFVVYHWAATATEPGFLGLQRWQAAFLVVGAPGLLAALWVASMREPKRGLSDGVHRPPEEHVFRRFLGDVASVVPPFTLLETARCGRGTFAANAVAALLAAAGTWLAIRLTGDVLQWAVVGVGYYAAFSSAQILRQRDRATFALTWKTPAFLLSMVGFGLASMLNVNMGFWTAPLALRTLPTDAGTVGLVLGIEAAVCGMLGVIVGGRLSDYMLRVHPAGRVIVGLASAAIPVPFVIAMCVTRDPLVFFASNVPVVVVGTMWIGAGAATIQELVLPRMRGTATITYFLASTLLGSALGPYIIGKISTAHGSLAYGVLAGLGVTPIAAGALLAACFVVPKAIADKTARARAAGEPSV